MVHRIHDILRGTIRSHFLRYFDRSQYNESLTHDIIQDTWAGYVNLRNDYRPGLCEMFRESDLSDLIYRCRKTARSAAANLMYRAEGRKTQQDKIDEIISLLEKGHAATVSLNAGDFISVLQELPLQDIKILRSAPESISAWRVWAEQRESIFDCPARYFIESIQALAELRYQMWLLMPSIHRLRNRPAEMIATASFDTERSRPTSRAKSTDAYRTTKSKASRRRRTKRIRSLWWIIDSAPPSVRRSIEKWTTCSAKRWRLTIFMP